MDDILLFIIPFAFLVYISVIIQKTVSSTKNEKKRNSSLEFEEKVQANPDKYFDAQVVKQAHATNHE